MGSKMDARPLGFNTRYSSRTPACLSARSIGTERVTAHASQGSDIRRRFCLARALRQRVGGPIDGYHASRPLYAFARLKGQQAGSCSEIDHSLTWPKPRLTQNTVANSSK
jgi:hypothetical protein